MIELIQGLLLAFAFMVILMAPFIRLLRELGFGKQVHPEGPETHYVKEGTPTMGGVLVILVVVLIYLFLKPLDPATFAPIAMASIATATNVKPLAAHSVRRPYLTSPSTSSCQRSPRACRDASL